MTGRALAVGVIGFLILAILFLFSGGFMHGDCLDVDDAPPCAEVQEAN